jgi:predicted outer membrane repeat protein
MLEDVEIVLLPGDHHLQSLVMINGSSDVYIHGISALESTVRCTYFPNKRFPCEFDNLEIRDSRNVWIREITITECGPVSVGLFLAGSENVIVEDCIFKENGASGVFSFRSNKVYLVNNLVVDNQGLPLPSELVNHSCSGHITFTSIFNFRSSIGGGISITGGRNATCEVLIWKTTVANNSAPPPFETINIPNTFKPHGRGGGLSIVLQGSKDCHICLKDSTVKENRARLAAGGISYTLSQQASENSLTIDNSDIEGNICEETECIGGGIHFTSEGQGPSSLSNMLYMYDTSVLYNRAENGTGGGLVGVIFSNQSQYFISNCTFNGNVARREGSAIMLLSVTGVEKVGTQFSCWDCNFEDNAGLGGIVDDVAAFYAYRTNVHLYSGEGRATMFVNNTGGGVEVSLGLVSVQGAVEFRNNRAILGGGMRVSNRARVHIARGAAVRFINNTANDLGGALYARNVNSVTSFLIRNRGCFIQPNLPETPFIDDVVPQEWDINVTFQGNEAISGGDAIYVENINDCCWNGSETFRILTCDFPVFVPLKNSSWPFIYLHRNGSRITEPSEVTSLIATAATNITARARTGTLSVALGERVDLQVQTWDHFSHSRKSIVEVNANKLSQSTILNAGSNGTADYSFNISTEILPDLNSVCGERTLCGEHVPVDLDFRIPSRLSTQTRVSVDVTLCHPGYEYSNRSQTCECRHQPDYYFRITCDNNGRYFSVQDGLWVRTYDNNTQLEAYHVPQVFLKCSDEISGLPRCEVQFDNIDGQCAVGRKGVSCGTCDADQGYGITMDLSYCFNDCFWFVGVILFIVVCVTVVLGCILLLYFNIGVPNELRGFFFFVQVIGTVYSYRTFFASDSDGVDPLNVVTNLFAVNLPFPVCIHHNLTALWMAVLGYVPPFLAFSTVAIFAICARYTSKLANRTTLSGITFIVLIAYTLFFTPSLYLVNCSRSTDGMEIIHRFTGQPCFSLPHVVWLVVAAIIILVFVILMPIFLMVISCKHFNRMKQFTDAFSKGLKRKWYCSWDLIRRVVFITIGVFAPVSISVRILTLLLFEMIVFVVHGLSHPYEKGWINFAESVILGDLFFATLCVLQPTDRYMSRELTAVFVLVPYLYAVPMIVYLIGKYVWDKHVSQKWKERSEVYFSRENLYKKLLQFREPKDKNVNDHRRMSIFYVRMEGENIPDEEPLTWSMSNYTYSPLVTAEPQAEEFHYRPELVLSESIES